MNWQPGGWQPSGWQPENWQPEADETESTIKTQVTQLTGKGSAASGFVVAGVTGKAEPQ